LTGPVTSRWRTGPVAILLSLAVIAAACSNDHGEAGNPSSTTSATTTPPTSPTTRQKPNIRTGAMSIQVLSSQPDRVTGGDARISVTPPRDVPPSAVRVSAGGHDVTARLKPVGGHLEGTAVGFVEGRSMLVASAGGQSVEQRIRDFPTTGPMISGPQLPLRVCTSDRFGLGKATDSDCSAPEKVFYRYVSTDGSVKDLTDPTARPADLAKATIKGRNVPLVVREERGVINRSVYFLATIDPTPGGADSDQSDAAWNGRLVYRFGGGCGTTYSQGAPTTTVADPKLLAEGYAVATATFNTSQVQCNDVLSAETVMMVKERFIEEFGVPVHTIGEGASEGAIQQHLIVQNYPGLLDAVAAVGPFPDAVTVLPGVADCGLLDRFYATPAGKALTPEQRAAINGHAVATTCDRWTLTLPAMITPTTGCDPAIPKAELYDPARKRNGIRCTLQDGSVNQLGRDPRTGFARRPLDNVGVQYGLNALNAASISVDQFLAVNQAAGGYDIDGRHQTQREVADPNAVQAAYEDGRVSQGGGDQRKVPIIDVNVYADPAGDTHDRLRAFSLRDRLTGGNAKDTRADVAPNFQIWTRRTTGATLNDATGNTTSGGRLGLDVVDVLNKWLDRLDGDRTAASREAKLVRSRPAEAVDNCLDAAGKRVSGIGIYRRPGPCTTPYPLHDDPRTAAGAPRANAVLKCQLKPVAPRDYKVSFKAAQLSRLRRIFPTGVCDWTRAGAGQVAPGPGNRVYDDRNDPASRT
jgi:hypothetical protein